MRILNWNCNGAFRNKYESLSAFNADILIVQECEDPSFSKDVKYRTWANNFLWIGDNKNKGLGIFANSSLKLNALEWSNTYMDHKVKHFLPCIVDNNFQILAVWSHQNKSPNFGYIGQVWKYLQINRANFEKIIIAGDFNSNAIWDEWDRWWNHSDVVKELEQLNIVSAYHAFTNEQQGKETTATFHHQKNKTKPYHIDYVFASKSLLKNKKQFLIETSDHWINLSDHRPLIFDITL